MYLKFLRDKETDVGGVTETPVELTAEEMKSKISELEIQGTAKDGENSKSKQKNNLKKRKKKRLKRSFKKRQMKLI